MKKFSQSVFLSDFNFIVVNYLKPSMVTPAYLFIIILVNTLGTELNVEKKKGKIGQVLNVGNMFKNKEMSAEKLIFEGLVTMATTSKKKS